MSRVENVIFVKNFRDGQQDIEEVLGKYDTILLQAQSEAIEVAISLAEYFVNTESTFNVTKKLSFTRSLLQVWWKTKRTNFYQNAQSFSNANQKRKNQTNMWKNKVTILIREKIKNRRRVIEKKTQMKLKIIETTTEKEDDHIRVIILTASTFFFEHFWHEFSPPYLSGSPLLSPNLRVPYDFSPLTTFCIVFLSKVE